MTTLKTLQNADISPEPPFSGKTKNNNLAKDMETNREFESSAKVGVVMIVSDHVKIIHCDTSDDTNDTDGNKHDDNNGNIDIDSDANTGNGITIITIRILY